MSDPALFDAIVPIKSLDQAKSRLVSLSADQRADLALEMARTTLRALRLSARIGRIVVVTSDVRISQLADEFAATTVADRGAGLNAAWSSGLAHLGPGRGPALLVPADFLRLSAADVDALVEQWDQSANRIALLACKDEDGTNAVILPRDVDYVPAFGPGSFARHRAQAGEPALVLTSRAFALDIDSDEDLRRAAPVLGGLITYSPKVFLPLTQLCRDVCHYCTFAKTPGKLASPYMTVDQAVAVAERGKAIGCKEALFTLGERPELRYSAAREWLNEAGFASTLEYVAHVARAVRDSTGLLPHINARARAVPSRIARQGFGSAAGHHRRGRTPGNSVHHRHPHRHRRDPRRTNRHT